MCILVSVWSIVWKLAPLTSPAKSKKKCLYVGDHFATFFSKWGPFCYIFSVWWAFLLHFFPYRWPFLSMWRPFSPCGGLFVLIGACPPPPPYDSTKISAGARPWNIVYSYVLRMQNSSLLIIIVFRDIKL